MNSIRKIGGCIGLDDNISFLKDFFGYTRSWRSDFTNCLDPSQPSGINSDIPGCFAYPETPFLDLSLLNQMKSYQHDHNVYLHVRIGFNPVVPINKMIYSMRKIYNRQGLGVVIRSIKNVNLSEDLWDLDVGATVLQECGQIFGTTDEQDKIFSQLNNNIASNEILVIFVRTLKPPATGCASHPSNIPGAVIAQGASIHTLSHKVGHVLGLSHVDDFPHAGIDAFNLMTGSGTNDVSNRLNSSQVETMKDSDYAVKCKGG